MITRNPTRAEILALAASGTATYEQIVELGIEPPVSDDNDPETVDSGTCTRCRGCASSRYCRNCYKCANSSHCDNSSWLRISHHCINCHGSDPDLGGSRSMKLYYCNNLHGCDRCIFTDNFTNERNVVYGRQVPADVFNALEALILVHIAQEQALEDAGP